MAYVSDATVALLRDWGVGQQEMELVLSLPFVPSALLSLNDHTLCAVLIQTDADRQRGVPTNIRHTCLQLREIAPSRS